MIHSQVACGKSSQETEPDLCKENEVSTLLILRFEMHSKSTFISREFKQPQNSQFILQSHPGKKVMFLYMYVVTEFFFSDCKLSAYS